MSNEFSNKYKNLNLKILFVDDEEKTRKYFAKGLEGSFEILTAESVDEAQKILDQRHKEIAVVITDQRMPGGNGVKLLHFLKEKYPHIIRLLTTAYSDLGEAIEAVNNGEIFRYIQKPWDYSLLKTELLQAVDLFVTKLERDKLLKEKITVRQTMARIERLRSLVIIAKSISYLRFCDEATVNFIRDIILNAPAKQNLQLGKSDSYELLSETLFILNIYNILKNKVGNFKSYDFSDNVKSQELVEICKKIANETALKIDVKADKTDVGLKINKTILTAAIKELLQQIALFSEDKIEAEFRDVKEQNSLRINFLVNDLRWSEILSIIDIAPLKIDSNFYLSLLAVYILIGHHGGNLKVVRENKTTNFILRIPYQAENLDNVPAISDDEIDDIILSFMME